MSGGRSNADGPIYENAGQRRSGTPELQFSGSRRPRLVDGNLILVTEQSFLDRLPDSVSAECARFLDSFRETIDFVFFVTYVVTAQDDVQRIAAEALLPGAEPEEAEQLKKQLEDGAVTTRRLQRFTHLIFEMLVTRAVDSYLTYVSDLLSTVFRARPEMLRSNEQVRVEFVLQHGTMDDLVNALAERRVERLAFAGMRELASNLRDALGFDLFASDDELEHAVRVIEDRNLIVHNRAVVNRTYVRRVPDADTGVGERLTFEFEGVFRDIEFLAEAAVHADARAATKWGLPRVPYVVKPQRHEGEGPSGGHPEPSAGPPPPDG